MFVRASGRDHPADRQIRVAAHTADLKLFAWLGDVEARAAEQVLQSGADAERQSSEGRDKLEPFVLHVGPQLSGQGDWRRLLAAGNQGRPDAHADRTEPLRAASKAPARRR